jgi:hypothetical protein
VECEEEDVVRNRRSKKWEKWNMKKKMQIMKRKNKKREKWNMKKKKKKKKMMMYECIRKKWKRKKEKRKERKKSTGGGRRLENLRSAAQITLQHAPYACTHVSTPMPQQVPFRMCSVPLLFTSLLPQTSSDADKRRRRETQLCRSWGRPLLQLVFALYFQ